MPMRTGRGTVTQCEGLPSPLAPDIVFTCFLRHRHHPCHTLVPQCSQYQRIGVAPACNFNAWAAEPVIVTVLVAVYKPDRSILRKGPAHHGGDVIATRVPGS